MEHRLGLHNQALRRLDEPCHHDNDIHDQHDNHYLNDGHHDFDHEHIDVYDRDVHIHNDLFIFNNVLELHDFDDCSSNLHDLKHADDVPGISRSATSLPVIALDRCRTERG